MKLAEALSKATGADYKPGQLPFRSIAFVEEEKAVAFKIGDTPLETMRKVVEH